MSSTAFAASSSAACFVAGPLAFAEARHWHRVVEVSGAAGEVTRLGELGLVPGARLFLCAVGAAGAVVQLSGHGRLAVDLERAQQVWVETAD